MSNSVTVGPIGSDTGQPSCMTLSPATKTPIPHLPHPCPSSLSGSPGLWSPAELGLCALCLFAYVVDEWYADFAQGVGGRVRTESGTG